MSDEVDPYQIWHAIDLSRRHLPDGILGTVISGRRCEDGIVLHPDRGNFFVSSTEVGRHRIFDDGTGRLDLYENGVLVGSRGTGTGQSHLPD